MKTAAERTLLLSGEAILAPVRAAPFRDGKRMVPLSRACTVVLSNGIVGAEKQALALAAAVGRARKTNWMSASRTQWQQLSGTIAGDAPFPDEEEKVP